VIKKICKSKRKIFGNTTRLFVFVLVVLLAASALGGCGIAGAYAESGKDRLFIDVTNEHWAYGDIDIMIKSGAVSGCPDGSFRPSENVTYGEFMKMMYMAVNGSELFDTGLSDEHWAAPYYYAALAEGYFDDGVIETGLLNKTMPRKHMAHATAETIRTVQKNYVKEANKEVQDIDFADVLPTGEYAYDIETACAAGILNGYPDGTFGGNKVLTRAEAVSVICRLTEYINVWKTENTDTDNEINEDVLKNLNASGSEDSDGKKSGQKIVRRVEKTDRIIPVAYEVIDTNFDKKGIIKIEVNGNDIVKIYCAVKYPFIKIMNKDGSLMKSIVSPEGNFFEENGMYIYIAENEGQEIIDDSGNLYMVFDDESYKVYRFSSKDIKQ